MGDGYAFLDCHFLTVKPVFAIKAARARHSRHLASNRKLVTMSSQSGSQGSVEEGNTISSSTVPRANGFYAWCFTRFLGSVDQAEWRSLVADIIDRSIKGICQLEKCPDTGKLHIQGYMVRKQRTRLDTLKRMFGNDIHWEKRRGSEMAAIKYCMKEESKIEEPVTWGDIQTEFAPEPRGLVRFKISDLRGWQKVVYEECKLDEPCDPRSRKIIYCWSHAGKVGKSRMAMSLVDSTTMNWTSVAGKVADAINVVANWVDKHKDSELHGVVLDCPRVSSGHLSWNALEQLSNGLIVNTKYETACLRFNRPHIVVMSNYPPPGGDVLSQDRLKVYEISDSGALAGREWFQDGVHD